MSELKYDKYFLKNPWGIKHHPEVEEPTYIGIGQESPVEGWDEPLTQVLRPILKPYMMIDKEIC